jgi:hypothetical protein
MPNCHCPTPRHFEMARGKIRFALSLLLLSCVGVSAQGPFGPPPQQIALAAPASASSPTLTGDSIQYKVRIVYLIPSNRQPQRNAERILQRYVSMVRALYREEMARLGYRQKNFAIETEEGSSDPIVHVAHVMEPDTSFHDFDYGGRFGRITSGLSSAGFFPFQRGEVLFVVAETHRQLEDGSLLQSSIFVGGTGNQESGISIVTGETLARMRPGLLVDDRRYGGLVLPKVGPYPLVEGLSFPFFEGSTLSSTSSSAQGAGAHELGHGFALWHDVRNDDNFNGNLMGNGLRGLRAFRHSDKYPEDDIRLSSAQALQLSVSRFFNAGQIYSDNSPPFVEILSSVVVTPANGLLPVHVRAFDEESHLTALILLRNGNVVAEAALAEGTVEMTLESYDYAPGATDEWRVIAFDAQGNSSVSEPVQLTAAAGFNRAPVPFIRLDKRRITAGESVVLDATRSFDPDDRASEVLVEWDLDGDGVFDTAPSADRVHIATFDKPGTYQVIARLTDTAGDSSRSVPVGLRVRRRVEDPPPSIRP